MDNAVIGIDIGTFESKGVLVAADGSVLAVAKSRHEISTPAPGHVEHDPEGVWWHDVRVIARELGAAAADAGVGVASLAVSAIGPCVVAVDESFQALRPAILYGVDTRAQREIDDLTARLGEEELLRRSGNLLSSQSAGPKIAWIVRNEPEVHAKTRWYTTSQSYLVGRLTGRMVIDHATAGYFHPFYDLATGVWTDEGLTDIVTVDRLPEIDWSDRIAGSLLPDIAAELGLPAGIPVVVGTTDAPAEAVGAGVAAPGDMMLMSGSSTYMIRVGDAPVVDEVLWSAPFVFEGTYVLAAGTSTAGTATRWVCDVLGLADGRGDDAMFGDMMRLAHEVPVGAGGALVLPHFSGERTPVHDPDAQAAIVGLTLTSSRGVIARAVSEGIGHSVAHALGRYAAIGLKPERIVTIGGGTKNDIVMSTVATLVQTSPVIASGPGAAFGDAVLAAQAVGILPRGSASWTSVAGSVSPLDGADAQTLREAHTRYIRTYEALARVRQLEKEDS